MTANVQKNDKGTGIRLCGLAGATQEAKKMIECRVAGGGASFLALMPGLLDQMQPRQWNEFQGDLRFLQNKEGCEIEIGPNKVDFRGTVDCVLRAKSELQKILHFYFPTQCETLELEPESVSWVAGEDDRELMRLQQAGAVVSLDRAAATLWLCGNPRAVENVRGRVQNSLQRWKREHVSLHATRGQCLAVIGSNGAVIRELQSSTGARVDVDVNGERISISGKDEAVAQAKVRILEIISGAGSGAPVPKRTGATRW